MSEWKETLVSLTRNPSFVDDQEILGRIQSLLQSVPQGPSIEENSGECAEAVESKDDEAQSLDPTLIDIPVLETERLYIRHPKAGDGRIVREAIAESFDELKPYVPFATKIPSEEESERNVRKGEAEFINRTNLWLLLFDKATNQLIGSSGLHRMDWSIPRFEIGYWVRTSCSGKGYITEAVNCIAKFAFEKLKAKRLEIVVDERNKRSCRVAERTGFILESRKPFAYRSPEGNLINALVYVRFK